MAGKIDGEKSKTVEGEENKKEKTAAGGDEKSGKDRIKEEER